MSAADTWKDTLRGLIVENFGLKLLSLACALALYAFTHGTGNAQRTIAVSVVSLMPPEDANRQLMVQLPTEVLVTLQGSRAQLDDLRADELGSVQLDLRSGRETRIDLKESMFHIPAGLDPKQINPASIDLRWDDVITRAIPIQVARAGDPAPGVIVKGAIQVDPPAVNARGPRSIVDVMQFARAAPFDVTGLTEGTYKRPLALDPPQKPVTYSVQSAMATAEIARELLKKELQNVKVEVVGLPRATTTPPRVTVRIAGAAEDLNGLLPEAVVPRVEPKSANVDTSVPGSAMLDVIVDVPRAKVEVNPPKVLVRW